MQDLSRKQRLEFNQLQIDIPALEQLQDLAGDIRLGSV